MDGGRCDRAVRMRGRRSRSGHLFSDEARDVPADTDSDGAAAPGSDGHALSDNIPATMEEFDSLVGGMDDEAKPEDVKVDEAEEEDTTA